MFDLAASAGAGGDCPYALIVDDGTGERTGFAITSADGVFDLDGAVMAEDQPASRRLAAGLYTSALLTIDSKEPPVTLLARG